MAVGGPQRPADRSLIPPFNTLCRTVAVADPQIELCGDVPRPSAAPVADLARPSALYVRGSGDSAGGDRLQPVAVDAGGGGGCYTSARRRASRVDAGRAQRRGGSELSVYRARRRPPSRPFRRTLYWRTKQHAI